jgi:capsular exopolysaccharide synthesis family protein
MRGSYLGTVLRRWPLLIVCIVAGVGSAYGITRGIPRTYEGTTTVLVNIRGTSSAQDAYAGAQLANQLAPSYAFVASSSTAARQVQRQLRLSSPPGLSASVVTGTPLIVIKAAESSPALAQAAAGAAASVFSTAVAGIGAAGQSVGVVVVDPASAGASPISPHTGTDLAYGALVGLLIGLAGATVLERLDRSFRDTSELERLPVGPVLTTVPRLDSVDRNSVVINPEVDSAGSDAYALLRTGLRFLQAERSLRSILVTSPDPQDGKTTTVANLAEVLAQAGETVVAVDGDLRTGGLSTILGLGAVPGLSSVLSGEVPLSEALLWRGRFGVLPAGPRPPNPAELLASDRMAALVANLARRADRVVIDATSVLGSSDNLALARVVDGVVLVLRPGQTRKSDIVEACRRLEVIGVRVAGCVLNAASIPAASTTHARSRDRAGWVPDSTRLKVPASGSNGSPPVPAPDAEGGVVQ